LDDVICTGSELALELGPGLNYVSRVREQTHYPSAFLSLWSTWYLCVFALAHLAPNFCPSSPLSAHVFHLSLASISYVVSL
jgi:hypothetical protein